MSTNRPGVYRNDHTVNNYPPDMYINYAKSIGLAIERRCMDYPPKRPADFKRIAHQEVNRAMERMRLVSGTVRQMVLNREGRNPGI